MSTPEHAIEDFGLPLVWIDFDDTPILFANHFLVQAHPDELVITVGQVTGPALVGTPEQQRQQLEAHDHVPIVTLARVGLTRRRAGELIALLQERVEEHDRRLG
jgi:hypothetical protein